MEVSGIQQLFRYQYSLKYIILCVAEERKKCQFGHEGE